MVFFQLGPELGHNLQIYLLWEIIQHEKLDREAYRDARLHLIQAEEEMRQLSVSSKLNAEATFLRHLHAARVVPVGPREHLAAERLLRTRGQWPETELRAALASLLSGNRVAVYFRVDCDFT